MCSSSWKEGGGLFSGQNTMSVCYLLKDGVFRICLIGSIYCELSDIFWKLGKYTTYVSKI